MTRVLPVFLLLAFLSCKKKEEMPKDILPPDKMEKVFWDYLKADSYSSLLKKDSSLNDTIFNVQLQNTLFKHHKIKKEDFYRSYQYYTSRPELMQAIIDSIVAGQQPKTQKTVKDLKNLY